MEKNEPVAKVEAEQFTDYVYHPGDTNKYQKCNKCGVILNVLNVPKHVCDPAFVTN